MRDADAYASDTEELHSEPRMVRSGVIRESHDEGPE